MKDKKFAIAKGDLQRELQKIGGVVSDKAIVPIFSFFLFELEKGNLTITGSDTGNQIQSRLQIVTPTDVSFCIEKTILNTLRSLPEQTIEFSIADNATVTIKHASGEFVFGIQDATPYMKFPIQKDKAFQIPLDRFRYGLEKTQSQMADDALRPIMNGVYLDIKKTSITFVATDAHTLAKIEDKTLTGIDASSFLIPRTAVQLLLKIIKTAGKIEDVTIVRDDTNIEIEIGNTTLTTRQITDPYPNYNAIIPKGNPNKLMIGSMELTEIMNRLLIVSESSMKLIQIVADTNGTEFSASSIDYGRSAKETSSCTCTGAIKICINGEKTTSVLSAIYGNVILQFADEKKPVILTPEDKAENIEETYLIMPLLIN